MMGTGLAHSTALVEEAKGLAPSNIKEHGKSTIPETLAKVYDTWRISAMHSASSTKEVQLLIIM